MVADSVDTKLVPRNYQLEGIEFLKKHRRALLFDDPGLGKTLQASMAAEKPTLIACPTYLVEQWADFLQNQFPNDVVAYTTGGSQTKRLTDLNKNGRADWYVVNIEMLRTYNFPQVNTLIIDESHHVRNRDAQQSKAAFEIASMTPRVYLLTATPIYKEADDLFFQLRIIAPKIFTSYHNFVNMYCLTEYSPYKPKITGVRSSYAIRQLLSRFAIGRSYKDVGLELPRLIEKEIRLNMPKKLMEAYKQIKEQYRLVHIRFSNAGAALQALRMATVCSEKLEAAKDVIDDNKNQRAVVFCWYQDTAHALGNILKCPVITGELIVTDRVKIAKGNNKTIVASLASLSEGVDLSAYKLLLFFEEDYTPGQMYQALSRALRYSSDPSPVQAYYIMMKNTIDVTVHNARKKRNVTAEQILDEAING